MDHRCQHCSDVKPKDDRYSSSWLCKTAQNKVVLWFCSFMCMSRYSAEKRKQPEIIGRLTRLQ